jgi:hypothetical protein
MAKVEIVRSFAYKLNAGNYESRDFFCSQKQECDEEDAFAVSSRLYQFCQQQVMSDVMAWRQQKARGTPP